MMPPRLERLPPLPLPVALLSSLWPREPALSGPVSLVVLIAVWIHLSHGEDSAWENFLQVGGKEGLEAAACLGHLRVRLQWRGGGSNYSKVVTSDDIETDVYTQKQAEFRLLTYVIELCTVAEHEIHVGHKLIRWAVTLGIPLAQLGPDHRQVHWPLDDLVVMACLCEKAVAFKTLILSPQPLWFSKTNSNLIISGALCSSKCITLMLHELHYVSLWQTCFYLCTGCMLASQS